MRHALSDSHLSSENFPQCSLSRNDSPMEPLPCAIMNTTEQLEDETCPSLTESYDERLMALLDCYKSPQYLDDSTGCVYAPSNQDLPVECEQCLSQILNRTYREICQRFRSLKQNLQSTANSQPNGNANYFREYNTPNRYQNVGTPQNDAGYLFGPSQSFPAHIARRPQRGVVESSQNEYIHTERGPVRQLNFSQIPCQSTEQRNIVDVTPPSRMDQLYNSMPYKDLADVSMPTYQSGTASSGYYSNKNNASERLAGVSPSFYAPSPILSVKLENITPPTDLQTASPLCQHNTSYPEENLNDVSMPCYSHYSQRAASYPPEMLQNINSPVFSSTTQLPTCMCKRKANKSSVNLTSQCLEDVSAPSFVQSSRKEFQFSEPEFAKRVTPQQYMTSECLEDISMPTQPSMRTISTPQTPQRQQILRPKNNVQKSMASEQLDDISMPYAPHIQMSPREHYSRNRTFPDEQLANVSAPVYASTPKSRIYCPPNAHESNRRFQRTMHSECLQDISSPGLAQSSQYSQKFPNECLANESMPTFASSPHTSRRQPVSQYQISLPSENLDNITAPEYAASCSRQRTMPSEWLDQQSIPVSCRSDKSIYKPIDRRQQQFAVSCSPENIQDISPPVFGRSPPSPIQVQQRRENDNSPSRLYNILHRVFSGTKNVPSERQQMSPNYTPRYNAQQNAEQQRVFTSERLDDISAPSLDRTRTPQYSATNKPQSDLRPTMNRSYEHTRARQWQPTQSLPRSRLEDISPPSYNKSDTQSVPLQKALLSKQRIQNISKSDMEKIRRRLLLPAERLEDQSMPSMPGSPQMASTPMCKRQENSNLPSNYVADISAPSFNSSQNNANKTAGTEHISALVNCLNDMLISHFGLTLIPQRAPTAEQEQLNDVTDPCLVDQSPSRYILTVVNGNQERIQDVTMPSLPPSMCSERLQDISMPTLENASGVNFDINNREHRGTPINYTCYKSDQKPEGETLPVFICSPQAKEYEYELNDSHVEDSEFLENVSPPRFITVPRTESGTSRDTSLTEDKQGSTFKNLLHKTKDVFSKLGDDRQTLTQENPTETSPVVPIPGSLKPVQNLKTFLGTNKASESKKTDKSKKVDDTFSDTTNLENISRPDFSSTQRSPEAIKSLSSEPEIPTPGTLKGFQNIIKLSDLAKNKVKEKERKRLESTKLEDISSPILSSTPKSSIENLQQQRVDNVATPRSAQQLKPDKSTMESRKVQKRNEKPKNSRANSPTQSDLDNITAPSFVSTPESIQQMRNNKSPDVDRSRSRTNNYDGPSTSEAIRQTRNNEPIQSRQNNKNGSGNPQSIPQVRNYETSTRSQNYNDDGSRTPASIPQIRSNETPIRSRRNNDTPAVNRTNNDAPNSPEFILQMSSYETPTRSQIQSYNEPSTSRGLSKSNSGKYQSSTSMYLPKSTSNKPSASTSREQSKKNSRTQTTNTHIWNAIEARSQRSTSVPRETHPCQAQPLYEFCNRCFQMQYTHSPSYCCVNYNPCQTPETMSGQCEEIVYECCYPCQIYQAKARRRSC